MKEKSIFIIISLMIKIVTFSQMMPQQGIWQAKLLRKDSNAIVFNFQWQQINDKPVLYVINGAERIKVDKITITKEDSIIFQMPVFESQFRAKMISKAKLEGVWIKSGAKQNQIMPFTAVANTSARFAIQSKPKANISGKWAMIFGEKNNPAIGIFQQNGALVNGSIVTPTGDYRYLSGVVNGDTLRLSTFDGSHAFSFSAIIRNPTTISDGIFYAGALGKEMFTAMKNDTATLPNTTAMYLNDEADSKLHFAFKNLDGKLVSIEDEQFKNKVVIVQLMGSWCPNCMDETAFLSDFYNKNKERGIEVIGLAYELTDNFERSKNSILKFKERFGVQYPLLVTGVTVSDEKRTEKTLPQLTPIKVFPSTIIVDKTGRVHSIDTGFYGPGTGDYYKTFKHRFYSIIDELVNQ
ncbi:peroxiredoxin family protein [Parasediminibacterium paludis]|uniref:Peroxiredoxin family protein n=1 Tax=Parasediminibacterium paludis TaxID=908966 RepID=A0ABV8PVH9_9BACT